MKPGSKVLAIALLFVGLGLVNFVASRLPFRADATAENIYTLSAGTRSLLGQIEEPLTVELYFSRSAAGLPILYKNYAARIESMLRQYERAGRGNLVLRVINLEPDTPAEEAAARSGLQPQLIPGTGEQIYFGIVATQADQQEAISALNPQREQFLEYDLSALLHSVQQFDKPRLGLLTSLPLRATPPANPMMMPPQGLPQNQYVLGEWEKTYEIVPIEPTATTLPADLDALAVIHPQNLAPDLLFALDQFLLAGRPLFLALDPASQHFKRAGGQQAMMMGAAPNVSSDLPTLLAAWGLAYDPQQVVGDLALATPVQTGQGQVSRFPVWLSLPAASLNASAPPTAQLSSLLFIEPGAVSLAPDQPDLDFTPLVTSSPQAATVPSFTLQFAQPDDVARQINPTGTQTLAALVTGTFRTAFPDRENATATGPGTLVIVTDTDWLMDDYSVRRFNFLGVQAAEPLNDNLAFGSNVLDFLAGSTDLLSIRGKGSSLRPFTVVREMEVVAQQRYQDQLVALESRLSSVQQQLTQLQSQTTDANRLVASPEVQQAIEDFQAQEAAMRRERREIRRALREDIDALKNRLLLANLLLPTILVVAFGAWFHRTRRP